jgi:hypothetical protein
MQIENELRKICSLITTSVERIQPREAESN